MDKTVVVGIKLCSACQELKKYIQEKNIDWKVLDGKTPDGLMEIAYAGLDPKSIAFPIIITNDRQEVENALINTNLKPTIYVRG